MNAIAKPAALPPGILQSDLEHKPPHGASEKVYNKWHKDNGLLRESGDFGRLTLYYTERFGWVITTLLISSGARRATSDRSYGVTTKGEMVRVGHGPHVKQTVTVYLREARAAALQPYIDLFNKGMERAHETRDSISTRRANTVFRRRSFF